MAETIPPSIVLIIVARSSPLDQGSVHGRMLPRPSLDRALIVALARSRRTELAERATLQRIARAFSWRSGPCAAADHPHLRHRRNRDDDRGQHVGIVYTLLVGIFIYRELDWRRLYPMLRETASLTGAIMLIIATATAMAWRSRSPLRQQLAATLPRRRADERASLRRPSSHSSSSAQFWKVFGDGALWATAVSIAIQLGSTRSIMQSSRPGNGHRPFRATAWVGYYAACAIGRLRRRRCRHVIPYILR